MYRYVSGPAWKPRTRFSAIAIIRRFIEYVSQMGASDLNVEFLFNWIRQDCVGITREHASKRTNCVARFVEWCEQQGLCTNPFAELERRHGLHLVRLVEIVRRPDYEAELAKFRATQPWSSHLAPLLRARIDRMQSLGMKYKSRERDFYDFDLYLQKHPELASCSVNQQVAAWAASVRSKRKTSTRPYQMPSG